MGRYFDLVESSLHEGITKSYIQSMLKDTGTKNMVTTDISTKSDRAWKRMVDELLAKKDEYDMIRVTHMEDGDLDGTIYHATDNALQVFRTSSKELKDAIIKNIRTGKPAEYWTTY